jgi:hypothetical protein
MQHGNAERPRLAPAGGRDRCWHIAHCDLRLESGTHTPHLETLRKIAVVLDEELLVCFQRNVDGEVDRDFAAVA